MKIVSPSLLACNFLQLENEIEEINKLNNIWYHLDVMDGHFVPNTTFGHPIIEQIKDIAKHPLDAHLMVTNPSFYLDTFKNYGIHNMTFHIETLTDPVTFLKQAKQFYPSIGISLRPSTKVNVLTEEILSLVDLLLIMSVEPGFAGQKFIESTWDRLSFFSNFKIEKGFKYSIQVDGGVSDVNSKMLFKAGANNLVTGSYIFKQKGNYRQALEKLI